MMVLIASGGVFILALIVFGGGQVFMPLFRSLWELMDKNGANIDSEKINNIFAISNATPGVIGTKFAVFTGYLAANGEWWGWIALILTYIIFITPSIVMIWYSTKWLKKTKTNIYLKNVIVYLKPVVIGILLALSIQLFIGTLFPSLIFNSHNAYIGTRTNNTTNFFSGWRFYVLVVYGVFVIIESFYFYTKKINLFLLIVIHIIIGMVLFEPWL